MASICKNCQTENPKTFVYCPKCSQKVTIHRLTFHDIIHEGIHYFTHADKGILQLIRDLILKRGVVAREYIDGKRKKYFPPLNFFLLIATVFVFMSTLGTPSDSKKNIEKQHPEITEISDPVKKQHLIGIYTRMDNVNLFTTKYSNLMAMCSLPLSSLVFWLFYRRNKYNYVEHVVAGMYMLGICILFYALIILPSSYLFHFSKQYAVLIFFLVQLIYFSIFYYGFLNKTTKQDFLKALGVTMVSLIVWVILSSSVIRIYISNGFWGLAQ